MVAAGPVLLGVGLGILDGGKGRGEIGRIARTSPELDDVAHPRLPSCWACSPYDESTCGCNPAGEVGATREASPGGPAPPPSPRLAADPAAAGGGGGLLVGGPRR